MITVYLVLIGYPVETFENNNNNNIIIILPH